MNRRTFKPKSGEGQKLDGEEIISKGSEVYEVDVEDLRKVLRRLRPFALVSITALNGEAKVDFDTIVNYVDCFYSSGNYESLHEVIREEFQVTNGDRLLPGSVAAYMIGSVATNDSCHPISLGSAPAPTQRKSCNERVLLASYQDGGYSFTPLNTIESSSCLLYLPDIVQDSSFLGLCEAEKTELSKLGVEKVKIRGYNGRGEKVNLSNGYVPLSVVQTREGNLPEPAVVANQVVEEARSYNLAFLLLLVIIIIILFFIAWKAFY
ncbi:Transmembrane domain-containing protein [Brazilian cedratvirus IHUMI]|uniref:Transmembrane domain-containing protein n=1 Tax=Brazilian cedratvirus IHUMI TaxID=2126980 RepID=A0A2R8FDU3_9VIRU|nr:Transmembrane domain-containing protein [Brazilian cedratvirus IHUMI]